MDYEYADDLMDWETMMVYQDAWNDEADYEDDEDDEDYMI